MKKHHNDKFELVGQKGVYPYEFMDNIDKFEYPSLPSKDEFYSSLKFSGISDANYQHTLKVYHKFKMF